MQAPDRGGESCWGTPFSLAAADKWRWLFTLLFTPKSRADAGTQARKFPIDRGFTVSQSMWLSQSRWLSHSRRLLRSRWRHSQGDVTVNVAVTVKVVVTVKAVVTIKISQSMWRRSRVSGLALAWLWPSSGLALA